MAGQSLSDGTKGVLAKTSENGRAGEIPEFFGLDVEFPEEITGSGDGADVVGVGHE